jgi:flagellar biosynthesis protein FlhA
MAEGDTSQNNADAVPFSLGATLGKALRHGDILLACGVIAILVVLIMPMPRWLLDFMLAFSLGFSVLVLLTALFVEKPLDFNAFPTVLLLSTMIRLALNMASTRLILSDGHEGTAAAGKVIEAFGGFIMGGNFVTGFIVFAILVIVNFVVITKGSGRIAEVSARFTLDSMPGKQMAIDADLSAGLIDEDAARSRRKELEEESGFFGAMDGAAKFVRGDAIAGLLITFINVIGGIIIGAGQKGMDLGAAADVYTRLSVGDGLVSQIPALIVSTAAGIIVTKASMSGTVDAALSAQIGGNPKPLAMSAFLLMALAMLPGIPALPFFFLAAVTGGIAWFVYKRSRAAAEKAAAPAEDAEIALPDAEEDSTRVPPIDDIRIEIGYGLLSLVNGEGQGTKLTDQVKALRKQLMMELGVVMPSVRIQDNMQLSGQAYAIRIKEILTGQGEVRPNMLLAIDPRGGAIDFPGEKTREPTFGLPAMWILPTHQEEALFRNYTIVEPAIVITTHLVEIVKKNISEMMSHAATRKLLDDMDEPHQKLLAELIPAQIAYTGIQRIIQNLLQERVSIRDLPTILEAVSEACSQTRSLTAITEHVRARLARQITDMNVNDQGVLSILSLSPQWEQAIAESLIGNGDDKQLALAPSRLQDLIMAIRKSIERHALAGETPVLVTSSTARPYVRSILERFEPACPVMSQIEVSPHAQLKTLGQI